MKQDIDDTQVTGLAYYRSKKLMVLLLTMIVTTVMVITGFLTGEMWIDLLSTIVPIYLGADVAQNVGNYYSRRGTIQQRYTPREHERMRPSNPDIRGYRAEDIKVDEVRHPEVPSKDIDIDVLRKVKDIGTAPEVKPAVHRSVMPRNSLPGASSKDPRKIRAKDIIDAYKRR